ncbi:glycosyltransferase involved in cell wall biosynthesis [Variovorax beijingensis]|uniref:Glycosyltransferase involved in cell wall biosynthesis n=1 Tax=Variovorax beijingensis TaxID=2496117 RepID=A0A561C4L8_9BURK|nr:glycosyltransferase family 4 protein [Variovorax beijingensis]TWD86093.1 glycosyltransferase involved in cell wall biosynthesis [Variovorax beijingensis]
MKILIPITGFGHAGGYRVLSELANHWTMDGHQVDFLVDERSPDPYFPTRARIHRFDKFGRLIDHHGDMLRKEFSSKGNAASIYFGMWRALGKIGAKYDVVLANHSLTAFPVAFARGGKASKYYYVQAYEPEYYSLSKSRKARVLEKLSKFSYRLNLRQIANAPIYLGYRDIKAEQWIPPGVDESIFHRRSSPPDLGVGKTLKIGTIGRKEASKGTKYVLEAFEKLALIDSKIQLKVAYGNLPDNWTHDRAEIIVPSNDRELSDFYRSIDILIAPGTVQLGACHYPVLEAMSCGTPVITTGYLPANKENSWIVPTEDSESIVSSVLEISASSRVDVLKKLDLAAAAIDFFYWKNVSQRFIGLFECR